MLRYCARPPFALERLSVSRGPDGRITRVRYVLPRHKAANGVGPGRGRTSTRPGANGVVELTPPRVPRSFGGPCPAAAEAPALLSRGVCAESQAAKSRHGDGDREHRQAVRRRCRRSTSTASEPCRGRGHNKEVRPPDSERLRADTRKTPLQGGAGPIQGAAFRAETASGGGSNPLTSRASVGQRLRKCHWPGYPFPKKLVGGGIHRRRASWRFGDMVSSPRLYGIDQGRNSFGPRAAARPSVSASERPGQSPRLTGVAFFRLPSSR